MPIERFPEPELASPEGFLAVGGDFHPKSLCLAYRNGIFPWPIEGMERAWFSPDPRAVLFFDQIHVSKSLKKFRKKCDYRFTIDQAFPDVMRQCALQPRKDQDGTWITPYMEKSYVRFHKQGFAHSVECWMDQELVGGVYGVCVEGTFAAESMFHTRDNASKLALLFLVEHLQNRGLTWIDIQVMTPHMEAMGAVDISRNEFLRLLKMQQKQKLVLFE